jgi:hypothetical protein
MLLIHPRILEPPITTLFASPKNNLNGEIRRFHQLIFIPDFSNWNHDSYQEAFQRLISDLKASDLKRV